MFKSYQYLLSDRILAKKQVFFYNNTSDFNYPGDGVSLFGNTISHNTLLHNTNNQKNNFVFDYKNTSVLYNCGKKKTLGCLGYTKNSYPLTPVSFFYSSGLFLKANGTASLWCKYMGHIVSTKDMKKFKKIDIVLSITMLFFLNFVSVFKSLENVKSYRVLKITPMVVFRFRNFFSFNVMGELFNKIKGTFNCFTDNEVFFVIKVNKLYNNCGIWGKKKKIKRAKEKIYLARSKTDSLYKEGSIYY